jgi:8-oxo-dGTP diphosphatase
MKHVNVVSAIIINDGKILCVQRDVNEYTYISMKYEFPGGKVEPGESRRNALAREVKEELGLDIQIQDEFLTVEHIYPDFEITMYSFICSCENNALTLSVHIDYKWLYAHELRSKDWAAADVPIVEKLINCT